MQKTIPLIFRTSALRISTVSIFFYGTATAANLPYQSLIGINDLGLSAGAYSIVMFLSSLVSVTASIAVGIISDRMENRRALLAALALFGVAGFGIVYLWPSSLRFVVCNLLLIPLCTTMSSVLYGTVRMTTNSVAPEASVQVNSTVRAVFSASWILIPGLLGFLLADAPSTLPAYLAAAISSLVCLGLFVFFGAFKVTGTRQTNGVAADFRSALKELSHRRILIRIAITAVVSAMVRLSGIVSPLLIERHGSLRDVGIVAGAIALFEIPFMLMWGAVHRKLSAGKIIALSGLVYAAYLVILGVSTETWQFYALVVLSACGAAGILSITISYLQDLLMDRPGLGSSLMTVNSFISNAVSAGVFALGSSVLGYSGTAILSGAIGLAGIAALFVLEGRGARLKNRPPRV